MEGLVMKVLLLGGTGHLGPHVIKAIEPYHQLLVTDINPPKEKLASPFRKVDITSLDQVLAVAEGMDAIINLAVLRRDPRLAFEVNARGCYHTMLAAVEHGIPRVINTGPHFTVAGPTYEAYDYEISPDAPPHSGTNLYALTDSLGLEILRVFSENYDIYTQTCLFYSLQDPEKLEPGGGGVGFLISWADAGEAVRLALEVELAKLPSRCEVFFVLVDMPLDKFSNEKAKRLLGFRPKDSLSISWQKAEN
jgi:nucleoside-diphosphate-sugar epimerase